MINHIYNSIINAESFDELLSITEIDKYAAIEIYSINKIMKGEQYIVLDLLRTIIKDYVKVGECKSRDNNSQSSCINRVINELILLNDKKIDCLLIDLYLDTKDLIYSEMNLSIFDHDKKYILNIAFLDKSLLVNLTHKLMINDIENFNKIYPRNSQFIDYIFPLHPLHHYSLYDAKKLCFPSSIKLSIFTVIKMMKNDLYFGVNNCNKFIIYYIKRNLLYTYLLDGDSIYDINDINEYISVVKDGILNRRLYLYVDYKTFELILYNSNDVKHKNILNMLLINIRKFMTKNLSINFIEYDNIRLSPFTMLNLIPFEIDFNLNILLDKSLDDINFNNFPYLQNNEDFKYKYMINKLHDNLCIEKTLTLCKNMKDIKYLLDKKFYQINNKIKYALFSKALEMDGFINHINYFENYDKIKIIDGSFYNDKIINNLKYYMKYSDKLILLKYNNIHHGNKCCDNIEQKIKLLLYQYECKKSFNSAVILQKYMENLYDIFLNKRKYDSKTFINEVYNVLSQNNLFF